MKYFNIIMIKLVILLTSYIVLHELDYDTHYDLQAIENIYCLLQMRIGSIMGWQIGHG